jgi:hypothetical protein
VVREKFYQAVSKVVLSAHHSQKPTIAIQDVSQMTADQPTCTLLKMDFVESAQMDLFQTPQTKDACQSTISSLKMPSNAMAREKSMHPTSSNAIIVNHFHVLKSSTQNVVQTNVRLTKS